MQKNQTDMNGWQPYPQDAEAAGQKNYRARFLIIALIVLAAVLCAAAVLLVSTRQKTQKYNSYISSGNQYYTAGAYEYAIAEYEKALEVDDGKASAYLNLSYAYEAAEDYDSALQIMEQGCGIIDSDSMQERLTALQSLVLKYQESASTLTEAEILTLSANVTIENSVLDMVAQYTYTDYYREYGEATEKEVSDGTVTLYYSAPGIYVSYYNMGNEVVLDSDGTMPLANKKACSVRFEKISTVFGNTEDTYVVSRSRLEEILEDAVSFWQDEESGDYYMTAEYKGCKLTVQTDENGNIVNESAWNEAEPLSRTVGDENDGGGKVSGYVMNAVTGDGIAATLYVRERGSETGTILDTISSSSDGSYSCKMEEGTYTVEVSANGFVTEYVDMEFSDGQTKTGENIVISPSLESGEIRIVLTWGSYPSDLDSYAMGTSSTGTLFNICFRNRTVSGVGQLDVDDTNGYGPETTTITDSTCSFTFYVVDFTGQGVLASSEAVVKVYLAGESQPYTFYVPTSAPAGEGHVWEVFSYENGAITSIDHVGDEEEYNVTPGSK
ncbi:MAG: hypothetical protein LIO75_06230 [Lachnospiraceae bacterium]|nr:hypothetical protein [Lachnospiraceae bacterium]